jgi:hypothetical protein
VDLAGPLASQRRESSMLSVAIRILDVAVVALIFTALT